ncbi:2,3-bisphosphoglycerate-independent phosphoglycerate mutase [Maribacter sp. 6B07]|uniref:2,3-bisphosphoglycerate-independent phosphoglycerate mutase n=1 Tax=Maribacter dokdonensis TaxID=320912 RepID=A0ABY0U272_9FLAO|nr:MULTISPECIES: 2,3-bisphosphoglycerate-independent phosphoglycerate mutase [Maribacter]MDP2527668.1 2,3-bisphosphoglycerate-independent phosphoglycerate mutase [Maribacter dokdonensis]PHN92970.1 2,3-bisphosphoglycerate-independent phosphoglycerate mutase [Maribacter sp. 6B07]SDR91013.1 2,3-bisphosphoglycerate-independent phosphoglycerate mutase [Maribacter dokdonensis]HAF78740.1 2,3-bisphosphoglycerate-independent phosphoglycerate mutase [Maribacter sp.]|tara:strand:+ start:6110 stop:7627 length:1518 start_codon:yes stop_codon:yes gene_type:complete
MNKKVILMILDGWGKSPDPEVSAVDKANTPFIDSLYTKYANSNLLTDGMNVGLPEGQMGNSEVGHMNLGAGRIVYQDLAKINKAVNENTLSSEPVLKSAFDYAKKNNKDVHFLGLLSDGGVHSHTNHIKGLIAAGKESGVNNMYLHAFTDGRDVDPKSGKGFLEDIVAYGSDKNTKLATVIGRYYAMDRDKRWERVKEAYDVIVNAEGEKSTDIGKTIQKSYDADITDEFIKPIVMTNTDGTPIASVKEGDVVIFFNFRTDRGRELTQVLSQVDMHEQNMHKLDLYYVTLTNYDESYNNVHVVYNKDNIVETLGEVLSNAGKKQIRIAETEKYPHVTFFFNGGREVPFEGESRILCPSPKVATYDLQPEMSAFEIRDKIIPEIKKGDVDFICLNFANPDMVGHTGDMNAAIKACETVDECAKDVITAAIEKDFSVIVIADHGNCETMINEDGSPNTAHTTNPVPLILVDKDIHQIKDGVLGDIAPTILKLMGVEQSKFMTQNSLV